MAQRKKTPETFQPLALTVSEVADRLALSRMKVYDLIYNEGLPTIMFGRSRRVMPDSLQKWLKEREQSQQSRLA